MTPPTVDPQRVYRTPAHRFRSIPDFDYDVKYSYFGSLRYAFIDALGPIIDLKTGQIAANVPSGDSMSTETILCLHGEPSWSFLYRKMIPGFLYSVAPRPHVIEERRYIQRRVVAPDFIGFGRSDKPMDDEYYTWDSHRNWLFYFVQHHLVEDSRTSTQGRVTLVVQDWGGLLGLLLPNSFPSLFTHLIVMNTGLGIGKLPSKGWVAFRDFIRRSPDVDVGALLQRGTPLTQDEVEAYRAPFQGSETKAGVRRFPQLVPVHPKMRGVAESISALAYYQSLPNIAYESNELRSASVPQSQGLDIGAAGTPLQVLVCVGESDPVLGAKVMSSLAQKAWGESLGYWWHTIPEAGHFVQEWAGHLPGLADRAFSGVYSKAVHYDGQKAEWIQPVCSRL